MKVPPAVFIVFFVLLTMVLYYESKSPEIRANAERDYLDRQAQYQQMAEQKTYPHSKTILLTRGHWTEIDLYAHEKIERGDVQEGNVQLEIWNEGEQPYIVPTKASGDPRSIHFNRNANCVKVRVAPIQDEGDRTGDSGNFTYVINWR